MVPILALRSGIDGAGRSASQRLPETIRMRCSVIRSPVSRLALLKRRCSDYDVRVMFFATLGLTR